MVKSITLVLIGENLIEVVLHRKDVPFKTSWQKIWNFLAYDWTKCCIFFQSSKKEIAWNGDKYNENNRRFIKLNVLGSGCYLCKFFGHMDCGLRAVL